jgi:ubiquinone/menaquinone biosynthesis C-methylase UbiE
MIEQAAMFGDGAAYERRVGRWSRLAGEVFLDWIDLQKGLSWLDIGCGSGAFTELLIERCAPAAVSAIDPSEAQLAYARTRPGAKRAQFRHGDAQNLAFADDSFDATAMALVIQFIPDPVKAVAEMARVVRPGGMVGAYVWEHEGRGAPFHPMHDAIEALGIAVPMPSREIARRESLHALWEKVGLQSVDTRVIRFPVVYSDFDDFWISNSAPDGPRGQIMRDMSPQMREKLRAHLLDRLSIGPDGRIVYEAVANAVKGRVPS